MKKLLQSAVLSAWIMSAVNTGFAASNPFSDVPAGHWAYDAISQLTADGIIEGYGDYSYRGDRIMTRYEMAQRIAKALAKHPDGVDKTMLDKLSAEFSDELNSLGVRVSNLERQDDNVQFFGKIEYKNASYRIGNDPKTNTNEYVFRLNQKAEVNDHWTVNSLLESYGHLDSDSTPDTQLSQGWAQGDYDSFSIKLGKFELYPDLQEGILWDTEMSGVEVSFGNLLKVNMMAGRHNMLDVQSANKIPMKFQEAGHTSLRSIAANLQGIELQYDTGANFFGGAGYYHLSGLTGIAFEKGTNVADQEIPYTKTGQDDRANLWIINAGYHFTPKAALRANYAKNQNADYENNSWQAVFEYGDYTDASEKGQWGAYIGYKKFGTNVSAHGTWEEDVLLGTKGFVIGAQYAPVKNVGLLIKYFNGKLITDSEDGNNNVSNLYGCVEFFF